jgi:hypothetical protein
MKRLIVISAAVIFAVILVFGLIAQGPPGGGGGPGGPGGPGGGMMMAANMQSALTLTTERSLAYLLLEMNIPKEPSDPKDEQAKIKANEQLARIRATYLKSWKAYKELATKLEKAGTDRDAMLGVRADAGKINEKRIAELKDILSADDMKKLNDYEIKLNERPQRQRGGAGGGGPQGGGQPQGGGDRPQGQ